MSLLDELKTLVGDKADAVFKLVNKPTAMQKYLATEAGKAAKKRANDKWRKKTTADKATVLTFLQKWGRNNIAPGEKVYETGTNLWHLFTEKGPRITRKEFISLLPELPEVKSYVKNGKRVYSPAYEIDVNQLSNL